VNEDRAAAQAAAMPKLYGAPAYARPPLVAVNPVDRPFDPDDLPIEAERTKEDEELVRQLQPHPYERVAVAPASGPSPSGSLHARPFRLRLPGRGR
jgi:hypothetical protein